jgi:hypothetical protein
MKSPVRIFFGGKGFQTGPGEEIAQIDAQEASGKSYHLVGEGLPEISRRLHRKDKVPQLR